MLVKFATGALHLFHPFGRRRLLCRFSRLSDVKQLLWVFALVAVLDVVLITGSMRLITLMY